MTIDEAINKLNWALDNNTIEDVQSAYEYIEAVELAIEALEVDARGSRVETQVFVVKGGINHDFESCDKCKYCELEPEVCRLMGCIHAWSEMRDCYKEEEE